jgi:hypothetical protein
VSLWNRLLGRRESVELREAPAKRDDGDWSARLARWEQARNRLRVRIYPDAWASAQPIQVIARADYPGLTTAVVLDLPTMSVVPNVDHLKSWNQSANDVLAIAVQQALAEPIRVDVQQHEGIDVVLVTGDHLYTSANVFAVERLLPDRGSSGVVVALPSRQALLFHRLGQAPVEAALATFARLTHAVSTRDEHPLSADLFWWRDTAPPVRIGTSAAGVVSAILDAEIVRAIRGSIAARA